MTISRNNRDFTRCTSAEDSESEGYAVTARYFLISVSSL